MYDWLHRLHLRRGAEEGVGTEALSKLSALMFADELTPIAVTDLIREQVR